MTLCGMKNAEVLKKLKMQSQILFRCIGDMHNAMYDLNYSQHSEDLSEFETDTETMKRALNRLLEYLRIYYVRIEREMGDQNGEQ
jgi:hypothetical protein